MKNRRKIIWGCLGSSAVVLLLAGIGFLVLWFTLPEVSKQIPDAPTVITLSQPFDGAYFPPDGPITLEAQLVSATKIRSVEWWVNGQLNDTSELNTPAGEAQIIYWAFSPEDENSYQVLARAISSDSHSLDSNLVHIYIADGSSGELPAEYVTQEGQTLEDLAGILGKTIEQLNSSNLGLPQTGPLPAGTIIQAPVSAYDVEVPEVPVSPTPSQQDPAPPQSGIPPSPPPNKLIFWLGAFFNQSIVPNAPALNFSAEGCDVRLFLLDQATNEQGFNLYRYDTKGTKHLISQIGPSAGTGQYIEYVDVAVSQPAATYLVSAYNQSGQAQSNLVQFISEEDCTVADPPQRLPLELTLTPHALMDRSYCYFAVNQGAWRRIPTHPDAFLVRTGPSFDLSASLAVFSFIQLGDSLDLECWGWAGSDLEYLGRGQHTLTADRSAGSAAIELDNAGLDLTWENGGQTLSEDKTYVVQLAPPGNLRVTSDTAECASHYGSGFASLLAGLVCGELIAPPGGIITHHVLAWEWEVGLLSCFPQPNQICFTIEEPDGYYLYKIPIHLLPGYVIKIPENLAPYKHIPNPDQKVVVVPLPWPPTQEHISWCYGVAAYKDVFGVEKQEFSNLLCLGINYP